MGRPTIVVRRAEARDAEALVAVFAAPQAIAGTLQLPFPSVAAWTKRIADVRADEYFLVAEVNGEVVGNLGLHAASKSPRRRHAGAVGMGVRDDWQRRGVGAALLHAAIDLADNWIGYTRLELTVFTDNAAAVALYRKFGFVIEGTARRFALRDGDYADAYLMARHAPATEPAKSRRAVSRKSTKTERKRKAVEALGAATGRGRS